MRLYLAEGLGFEPSHNGFRDRRATATLTLSIYGNYIDFASSPDYTGGINSL